MLFKATDDQIRKIATLAVNAAAPMGLGFIHATPRVFVEENFKYEGFFTKIATRRVSLDYVEGRMVKLNLREVAPEIWEAYGEPRGDYQSWCGTFPTYADLVQAAGCEVHVDPVEGSAR